MTSTPSNTTDTAAQALADKLRHQIQTDGLPVGSFFGTEAELAQRHGVSRVVAREAVMRLKSLGILESRKRKGLMIRRPDPLRLLSESLPMLVDSEQDIRELSQLRYALEVGAIELAVRNATEEQIEELEQLANDFDTAIRDGQTEAEENKIEIAFHSLILQMTGSRLIAGMQDILTRFFELTQNKFTPSHPQEQTAWQHHALAAAIRDRDVERARTFVRNHFKDIIL